MQYGQLTVVSVVLCIISTLEKTASVELYHQNFTVKWSNIFH